MPLVIQEPLTEEEKDMLLSMAAVVKEERRQKQMDECTARFWEWFDRTKPETKK